MIFTIKVFYLSAHALVTARALKMSSADQDQSVVFQFNDSSLDMSISELDISIGSSGSPSPRSSRRVQVSRRGDNDQRDWRRFLRKADADEEDVREIIISDNIHGHIVVPKVCQAVIDTPQFDRLRGLRQLGSAHYVYPAAKHSRWEHSLGVMHLAGELVDRLRSVRPGCADDTDKICVMLAGLCHDLGHGPFSHLWESFVREARNGYEWHHEKTSIAMLDYIITDNNLMPIFEDHGLTEQDIIFVKELIYGPFQQGSDNDNDGNWPYVGRGPEKYFLYEIVANKISSVDVDKWDYMLRDDKAMNLGITFDYKKFILNSGLMDVDGRTRMCVRDKEADNVQDMFKDRARLHSKGYQHRTILTIDRMILDSLLAADPYFPLFNSSGETMRLSEACDNIEVFSQLTDEYLIRSIQVSFDPRMTEARDIVRRISKRELYKTVGQIECSGNQQISLEDVQTNLQTIVESDSSLDRNDMAILRKRVTCGMGRKNPVEKVLFFDKRGQTRTFTSELLRKNLPRELSTVTYIFVVKKIDDESVKEATETVRKMTLLYGESTIMNVQCPNK